MTTAASYWPSSGAGRLVEQAGLEAIRAKGVVLAHERVTFLSVDRKPKAANGPERVTREICEPHERVLAQLPEASRPLGAEAHLRAVIRYRCSAEREPAVAATRSPGDLAPLVDAHAQPVSGEGQRARAPRDTRPYDGDVHRARGASSPGGTDGLLRPIEPI